MKKLTIISCMVAMLLAGNTRDCKPIKLNDGAVLPLSTFKLDLSTLPKATFYILCTITNKAYQKEFPMILRMVENTVTENYNISQFSMTRENAPAYAVVDVSKCINNCNITFINFDDSETALLSDCKAVYWG